jgi:hypothetical protein
MSTENALRNKLQTSTNNSNCGKNKKIKKPCTFHISKSNMPTEASITSNKWGCLV